MFAGANSFNQPLNKWNVSNVDNMWSMFAFARSFNQPLNDWNVSKVTYMYDIGLGLGLGESRVRAGPKRS